MLNKSIFKKNSEKELFVCCLMENFAINQKYNFSNIFEVIYVFSYFFAFHFLSYSAAGL